MKEVIGYEYCPDCDTEYELFKDKPFVCKCKEIRLPCDLCASIMSKLQRLKVIGTEEYPNCDWEKNVGCHKFKYKDYQHLLKK
jgi:hypothetical protein